MVDLARLLAEAERRQRRAFDLAGIWAMHEGSGSIGGGLCHRYLVARPGRSGREAAKSPPQSKPRAPGHAGILNSARGIVLRWRVSMGVVRPRRQRVREWTGVDAVPGRPALAQQRARRRARHRASLLIIEWMYACISRVGCLPQRPRNSRKMQARAVRTASEGRRKGRLGQGGDGGGTAHDPLGPANVLPGRIRIRA